MTRKAQSEDLSDPSSISFVKVYYVLRVFGSLEKVKLHSEAALHQASKAQISREFENFAESTLFFYTNVCRRKRMEVVLVVLVVFSCYFSDFVNKPSVVAFAGLPTIYQMKGDFLKSRGGELS